MTHGREQDGHAPVQCKVSAAINEQCRDGELMRLRSSYGTEVLIQGTDEVFAAVIMDQLMDGYASDSGLLGDEILW